MIFQKFSAKSGSEVVKGTSNTGMPTDKPDEVETVVGPSVKVEGDFASEGNIVVKGTVAGSVHTSKHLLAEQGAKIMANVRAASVKIAGEVRGNLKVKESLELTSTAKVLGDMEAKVLIVEAGALICGKVTMPGFEQAEIKGGVKPFRPVGVKRPEETPSTII